MVALQSNQLTALTNTSTTTTTNTLYGNSSFNNGFQITINRLSIPKGLKLRSGYSATATIVTNAVKDVPVVPERVLRFEDDKPMVLIPDDSKQGYRLQPVKLGLSDGIHTQILSGVKLGEKVVDNSMISASGEPA
ncbi:efflux RND transporter periplasmic adaptor subunit [Dongshaea marina]|uniref:efflux RND transporter periplasmic adaptor subunit n=1 Tax=Dongshaea marina TaxID=2047966 RepID=UPI000D3ED09B|nr:efflux RND transporter periplasmic adaptor subunit [Dongshaea marina]